MGKGFPEGKKFSRWDKMERTRGSGSAKKQCKKNEFPLQSSPKEDGECRKRGEISPKKGELKGSGNGG